MSATWINYGKGCRIFLCLFCLFGGLIACSPTSEPLSQQVGHQQQTTVPSIETPNNEILASQNSSPTIMVLGDSLSVPFGVPLEQGWVSLLTDKLKAQGFNFNVVNISTSGDTTFNGLSKLPSALEKYKPELVMLELGANDGLRGANIEQIEANLKQLIMQIQGAEAKVLLLGIALPPNYGDRYAEPFRALYPKLAEEFSIELVPFFLEGVATKPHLMQDDGLHPTEAAQPYILENIWPYLKPML